MNKQIKAFNPFYPVLLVVGVAFAITASAYGISAAQLIEPGQTDDLSESGFGLVQFMDRYGVTLMMWELGALAVATFAAIGTDEFWTRRAEARAKQDHAVSEATKNQDSTTP